VTHAKTTLDLTDKVALITGASRGIGAETAVRFGMAGARVAVNYNRGRPEAEEIAATIGGDRAFAIGADMADPNAVEAMVDTVVAHWGRLDILVNNAAVYDLNQFERDDFEGWQRGWRRTFEVNVFGAANAAFLAMRVMRRQGGGKIINVASRAAFRGETEFADYGASKAALVNLTRSIARSCAKDNIVASCVAPGFILTEMARGELEKHYDDIVGQIPLRRVGTVDDVAAAILFLASPLADYLNGVTIDINGGSWFQ
jgi:NAD(P)-dependent dehydrogenase (short-subunit alcohol dehydrogenase family)